MSAVCFSPPWSARGPACGYGWLPHIGGGGGGGGGLSWLRWLRWLRHDMGSETVTVVNTLEAKANEAAAEEARNEKLARERR